MEFSNLPRVTDPSAARRLPELAVLSAMAHPELEVVAAAVPAISELPEDRARLYLDVILAALPPLVRKMLETQMQGYVYQSEFARKYYSQGLEQGREQGLEQGREQGLEQGREQGLRSAVRALVRAKLEVVTAEDEAAIAAVHDERVWTELIAAIGRATSALDVRAALAAAAPVESDRGDG
jgi:flagellar biosynthesis/type III secretory pathway protein FliH